MEYDDIHNKVNSIFSSEFIYDKILLLSPKRSPRKKRKGIYDSSNILTKIEKRIKNKEEN